MSRVLIAVGVVLAVLVALGAAVGWLAYGAAPDRDGERTLAGIAAPVSVAWPDAEAGTAGGVVIEAATWTDAAAGLGYAHAADHAFTLALWRQAARGETAAWFGDTARAADLHARRLGLDALARQTYDGLDAPTRARLDAYARGVNAALAEPGVAQSDAFVWLGLTPEPWQPWDALAVERLLAYLATPAPDSSWATARASPDVARFVRDDAAFRRSVAVSGTAFGRAFSAPARDGRALVLHQPGGASALPLVVPVAFHVAGRRVAAASVPGTLTLLVGTDGGAAWAVLLTSDLRAEPFAGAPPLPVYSRVVARDGRETLVAVARDSSGLVLGPPALPRSAAGPARADSTRPAPGGTTQALSRTTQTPSGTTQTSSRTTQTLSRTTQASSGTTQALSRTTQTPSRGTQASPRTPQPLPGAPADSSAARPDSAAAPVRWVVRWAGFRTGTDAAAFGRLAEGRAPGAFALLRGDGLLTTATQTRILGRPVIASEDGETAFAADHPSARWAPSRLAVLAARRLSTDALARDARSAWAERRLPALIRALGPRAALPRALDEPVAFLRSWDGAYTTDAIAPTIFEAWLSAHRAETGSLPDLADSADVAILPYTLAIARGELVD
ncbi:MAG TPA: penicillin acylase family protein, partial [Rubricoccaceae bacterium]